MEIFETAKRVFKRRGEGMEHYFRCTVGPKKGKLVADPGSCGKRPDPKRVRHGKIVAKTRGSIRVHKTTITKKTNTSKRIAELNRRLNNLFKNRAGVKESLADYMLKMSLLATLVDWVENTEHDVVLEEVELLESIIDNITSLYESNVCEVATNIYSQIGYTVIFE